MDLISDDKKGNKASNIKINKSGIMSNSYKGWENREFEVEKIIKERQIYKQNKINKRIEPIREYLVKWVGYKIQPGSQLRILKTVKFF